MIDWFMGGMSTADFWSAIGQIMLLDLVLAGDNAVVIALACRQLPAHQRMWGILLGAAAAIVMRIIFTIGVTSLMQTPWLQIIGAVLLIWIGVKLLTDHAGEHNVESATSIWSAVKIVAIADLVMSLDNVIAIAAAAKGNWGLIIFGLALSVPLIISGATLVTWLLERMPILIWVGAGLLGWIAGSMALGDPAIIDQSRAFAASYGVSLDTMKKFAAAIGALIVVVLAYIIRGTQGGGDAKSTSH